MKAAKGNRKIIKNTMYSDFRSFIKLEKTPKNIRDWVGIDAFMLREWIENKFSVGMSWGNYGEYWVVDHIVPIRFFDVFDKEEMAICWNYKNLMPLLRSDNEKKNGNIYFSLYLIEKLKDKNYWYNILYKRLIVEYNQMQDYIDTYCNNNKFN